MKKTKDLLKKQEEIKEKVFTNKKSNNIIKTIYNPLKVNCKIYKRGSGLFMKETNEALENKEKLELKEFINKRVLNNINLFSKEELSIIKENDTLVEKLYMLGFLDNI